MTGTANSEAILEYAVVTPSASDREPVASRMPDQPHYSTFCLFPASGVTSMTRARFLACAVPGTQFVMQGSRQKDFSLLARSSK
jgi:hypothetical protein